MIPGYQLLVVERNPEFVVVHHLYEVVGTNLRPDMKSLVSNKSGKVASGFISYLSVTALRAECRVSYLST